MTESSMTSENYQDASSPKVTKCRICGNDQLVPCLDIGSQYLSSIFPDNLDYRSKLLRYPMDLVLCKKEGDQHCGLLQLGHELDLSEMYVEYPYTSSSNSSMRKILENVAQSGKDLNCLQENDLILDIGCNDGTLLSYFNEGNYDLLGIDAAQNVKAVFESSKFKHVRGFFDRKTFEQSTSRKARLVFSIAMFYHLSNPIQFASDVKSCLEDDGVWIMQMAYLPAMLKTYMYDNIVHEHVGYYGIESFEWVMEKAGLEVFDVLLNDVYGGSYRVFVKKKGCSKYTKTDRYHQHLADEKKMDLFNPKTHQAFAQGVEKSKADLKALFKKIKAEGKSVWIYGASTKGNTIMQYCGLGKDDVVAAADSNAFKFGKYIIGSDIPICDEKEMREAKPDYLLSLPYSFTEGFMKREEELIKQGTKFIVPLPKVEVLP